MRSLGLYDLTPRPLACPHDREGVPHRRYRDILRCIRRYGMPDTPFVATPREVGP